MNRHRAAEGFERSTQAYDHGRPEYLPEAAEHLLAQLGLHPNSRVLELGSGTGKFTRFLVQRTPHVLASDPSPAMRRAFHSKFSRVTCLAARAEQIPAADLAFDSVVCAQAFHWFGHDGAVQEITRVLAPRGGLGLIWNVRDEATAWVRGLTEIMDPFSGDTPRYRSGDWRLPLERERRLTPLEHASFRHTITCDHATVLDRVGSVSFIAALDASRHRRVLADVQELLNTHPETRGRERVDFPYRTDLYWCRRL